MPVVTSMFSISYLVLLIWDAGSSSQGLTHALQVSYAPTSRYPHFVAKVWLSTLSATALVTWFVLFSATRSWKRQQGVGCAERGEGNPPRKWPGSVGLASAGPIFSIKKILEVGSLMRRGWSCYTWRFRSPWNERASRMQMHPAPSILSSGRCFGTQWGWGEKEQVRFVRKNWHEQRPSLGLILTPFLRDFQVLKRIYFFLSPPPLALHPPFNPISSTLSPLP